MLVRRGTARLATVCTLLAGLVLAGAAPALADDDDSVRLGAPGSFTAGGSAGSITVTVTKRSKGCVSVQTALSIQLEGLSPDDVNLMVSAEGGQWRPLSVDGGGDGVTSSRVAPEKPQLCDRKSVSVRYRLAFAAGAPAGRVTLVGEAYDADGELIERADDTSRVNGAKGTPTSRTSESATPQPEESTVAPEIESTEVAVVVPPTAAPGLGAGAGNGSGGGIGSMVMVVGVGMVAIGIALLVLLLRRARGGRDVPDAGAGAVPGAGPRPPFPPPAGAGGDATMILPPPAGAGGDATMILPPPARGGR